MKPGRFHVRPNQSCVATIHPKPAPVPLLLMLMMLMIVLAPGVHAADPAATFDAANKLYEQGRYADAATAYDRLRQSIPANEAVWFNLGNALFKAGQTGQAIAAWRHAERINPRDPNLRFNLQFARKRVSGSELAPIPAWQRAMTALTLNEWSVLASVALWVWFALLCLPQLKPAWRPALRGYTATAGVATVFLALCVGAAVDSTLSIRNAVVTASEAIVRSGPLEEAKVLHQLRDGTELVVLDQKDVAGESRNQRWLQVRDHSNHVGWLKSDQVVVLD